MKTKLLTIAIILFIPFLIKGQPVDLSLNTPETGTQIHYASNSITFGSGYAYSPLSGVMIAAIVNPQITGNITYSTPIDPGTYSINTSLGVGKIPGRLAVNGSASYSIPIEIPAGTNGLQPSISLNYSSNFVDGMLGIGWNLGGISEINRIGKTIYNDGKSDAIRGDLTDKFALDGKRLLVTAGTYGSGDSEYHTEIEEFSKIVAYGTGSSPQSFKVYTKSGLIYDYGITTDSRITDAAGNILSWRVNKITDRYNNYITFSYLRNDNESPIGMIQYTGNSATSQNPFAQIIFNYKSRADVSNYVYGGKEFTRDILLDNIEVKSNGQTFKKYAISYLSDTSSQLFKVTENSSQNAALNPTVFAWTHQTEQFTQSTNYSNAIDEYYYFGDFNGDGREDMVTVPVKTSYTSSDKWRLYLADANGNLVYTSQGNLSSTFGTFLVGDFDGDGLTDLMMGESAGTNDYPNRMNFSLFRSTGTNFTQYASSYTCSDPSSLDLVDYRGDGKLEFLNHDSSGYWNLSDYTGSTINSGLIPSYNNSYIENKGLTINRIIDFNGDGCSDLLVLTDSGYAVYEFKGTDRALTLTCSGTNINTNDRLLFGDFNGDGKTDIIKMNGWTMMFLTSGGFQTHSLSNFSNLPTEVPSINKVFARDMNGDGKTDIVMVGRGINTANANNNRIDVAISSGSDFNITEYVSNNFPDLSGNDWNFDFGDFKGDGRKQLFYKNNKTTDDMSYPSVLFSFASGTPSHLVSTIIDGVGAKTNLTYLPMTNSSVYTRGTGATYPVCDYTSSGQLVSQLSCDNGIGGINSLTYQYIGAKIHSEGKGFLGFSKVTTTDATAGIITETQSGYDATYFYPQVNTITKKTTGGTTIETTTNTWTQTVLDATSKRILPYVQSTVQANALTGQSVTLTTSSLDSYGNPTQLVKDYGNGTTETTVNDFSGTINTADWLLGRIGSSTITYAKSGETSVSHTVRYTYSTDGIQKPDIIYYNEGTPLAYSKNYDYDSKGNLTQVYTSDTGTGAGQINYTYDSNGTQVLTSTDALGHVTTNTYDTFGKPLTVSDYLNNTVTYQYDAWDRTSTLTNSNGGQVTTTYVWTGTNMPALGVYGITQTGNEGSVATTWYDKLGRAIRSEKKGFGGTMILTDSEYNAKGQLYRVSDPYFAGGTAVWVETYTYDGYGRPTNITRNTGRNTSYSYAGTTVSETTAGKTFSKTYGPDGSLSSATDNGGTISYAYYADRKAKTITTPDGSVTTMQYADAARNQTQLVDPSSGNTNYTYNAFGQLKTQISARNQTTTFTYLSDGRTNNVVTPEGTTTYTYNANKQLTGISSPNGVSRTYSYDTKGRINSVTETIANSGFTTGFTYDSYGRLSTRTHPSGIVETMNYNSNGYMSSISAGGSTQYTITGMNARQQLTGSTYGSNLTATYGFDTYGYPTSTTTGSVQDYRYSFDPLTGNPNSRQNYLRNKSESFTYDNLDRLTGVAGPQNLTMTYNANGNISTKSDIGTTAFGYGNNAGPYALTGVTSSTGVIPAVPQAIGYTSFQSVSTIGEGDYNATFIYNSENQRAKMDVTQSGNNILTRWYGSSSYMKETAAGVTKEYTYLGGDAYSAPVVAVTQSGTTNYFYLLRDYLGNVTHQVNTSNNVEAEYSFDAWGRRRNPADWSYDLTNQPELFAGRGFTSHEYLKYFNLYNMNGRMYDPLVGRFLSPDNIIQNPDNTQNYNRYTYCLNNPLKYNDPSGWLMCPGSGGFTYSPTNMVDFSGHSSEELNNNNGGGGWGGNGGGVLPFDYGTIYNTWFGYSDWKKSCSDNTYRGSYTESNARYWSRVLSAASGDVVMRVIFGGTRTNPYQEILGFTYTDGSSYYYSDYANSSFTPSGHEGEGEAGELFLRGAKGFGVGLEESSGSFRLSSNGALSPKYYESGWTGGSRARITTYNLSTWGGRIAKGSLIASAGLGAYNVYNGYQEDGGTYGINAQIATGQAIGGIAGGWGGAMGGAAAGAAIGVWFGGVGAVPGSIIGGLIGSFGGGWAGSELGGAAVLQIYK